MPNPGPYGPPVPPPPPGPPPHRSRWQRLREDDWPPLRVVLRGGRQRMNGCGWALLLVPCTWYLVVPMMVCYVMARTARGRARRVFPPYGHRRITDPEVMRVQRIRAWTAGVSSILLLALYGGPGAFQEAQDQYWQRLLITPWLLLLTAPVVIAVVFRMASPEAKAAMRAPLRRAGRSAATYFGAVIALPPLTVGMVWALSEAENSVDSPFLFAPLTLALLTPTLWLLCFVAFASAPAVQGAFNAAEAHAALPALLTAVLVWELTLVGLVTGGLPPGPPLLQAAALVGGPLSVTAVAWWEIDRLRTRHGVRLRG
ncbi:hypothetical protein ACFVIM_23125 [Streptomyces sp. NPDC057638]|uniref:hypothetical protein n=1 Tax=Streptomyces sp. NPDC057638 TaxID=3346190 RepID=UPI00368EF740